jgi:hypothetical protein
MIRRSVSTLIIPITSCPNQLENSEWMSRRATLALGQNVKVDFLGDDGGEL